MKFSESIYSLQSSWHKKILLSLGLYVLIVIFFFLTRFPFFFSFPLFLYYPLWNKEWDLRHILYWFIFGIITDSLGGYPNSHSFLYFLIIYIFNLLAFRFVFIDTWRAAVVLGIISHILLFILYYFVFPGTSFFTKRLLVDFLFSQGFFLLLSIIVYPLLDLRLKKRSL